MSQTEFIIYPPKPLLCFISSLLMYLMILLNVHDSPNYWSQKHGDIPDLTLFHFASHCPNNKSSQFFVLNFLWIIVFLSIHPATIKMQTTTVSPRILKWPPKWFFYLQSSFQLTVYTAVIAKSRFDHVGLLVLFSHHYFQFLNTANKSLASTSPNSSHKPLFTLCSIA